MTSTSTPQDDKHVRSAPDRNLGLELVRATEAAALAAARWMGRGDKEAADQAAVDAMRLVMGAVPMDGTVVIGEGEKDNAPMLYNGERIGDGQPPAVDIAVDPVDGTTLTSKGMNGALAVIALSARDTMFHPGPFMYMNKIVVGEAAKDVIDIQAPVGDNLARVAKAQDTSVENLTVMVLDRPRHDVLVKEIREAGARVRFILDGDVAAAISAARGTSGIDMLLGIGGTPEGVISAAAVKCLGGAMQGQMWSRDDAERQAAIDAGFDPEQILTENDLVTGDDVFFAATGITDGDLVDGVRYKGNDAITQSIVMRSRSGTVRVIDSLHRRKKLARFSMIDY